MSDILGPELAAAAPTRVVVEPIHVVPHAADAATTAGPSLTTAVGAAPDAAAIGATSTVKPKELEDVSPSKRPSRAAGRAAVEKAVQAAHTWQIPRAEEEPPKEDKKRMKQDDDYKP